MYDAQAKSTRRGMPRQAESKSRSVHKCQNELEIFVLTMLLEVTFVLSLAFLVHNAES